VTRTGAGTRQALADVFDSVAEATVAPSFTRTGIEVRSRLESWNDPPSMHGRVVVVTGATSGIGLAAATAMARLGASLHLVGRDAARAQRAASVVEAAGHGLVAWDSVDMADAEAVRAFGLKVMGSYDNVDALVHNAGSLARSYATTPSGVETTVACQVLGPYVLTATLAPLLLQNPPATVIAVSSGGMYAERFDLDRLEMTANDYDGVVAYARAKRAQVVMAEAWAKRFAAAGVASYSMHPGWVDTPGLRAGLPRFRRLLRPLLRTPAQGADTIVWLAAGGPAVQAGSLGVATPLSGFYHDRRRRREERLFFTRPAAPGDLDAILAWCAARTGVETPAPR